MPLLLSRGLHRCAQPRARLPRCAARPQLFCETRGNGSGYSCSARLGPPAALPACGCRRRRERRRAANSGAPPPGACASSCAPWPSSARACWPPRTRCGRARPPRGAVGARRAWRRRGRVRAGAPGPPSSEPMLASKQGTLPSQCASAQGPSPRRCGSPAFWLAAAAEEERAGRGGALYGTTVSERAKRRQQARSSAGGAATAEFWTLLGAGALPLPRPFAQQAYTILTSASS